MNKLLNGLLIVTGLLAAAFGAMAYMFKDAERDALKQDDILTDRCEYIDIDLLRLDVTVVMYDGEDIRITYKNDVPLKVYNGDNKLYISESDEFVISVFTGGREDYGLCVYLPEGVYHDVTIYTGAGDVNLDRVNSEKITVFTDSGDISCERSVALSYFTTTSGRITVDFEQIVEESEYCSRDAGIDLVFPPKSSVALDIQTVTGECVTDLIKGKIPGSGIYGFNGGETLIHVETETGTLTFTEK